MGAGAAVAAGAVAAAGIGAMATSGAADTAANAQMDASNNSIAAQERQQAQTRADLLPYNKAGWGATNALTDLTGTGTGEDPLKSYFSPITMDEATLEQTPGYQFNLTQGLKATQNSAAARGLGVSGAALKGAASYATGLADNTYQNQFNNATTNQTNMFNRLMGISTLGENAAAQTGANGTQIAANIGNSLTGIGNAQAAAAMASGNAISSGASNAASGISNAYYLNSLIGGSQSQYSSPIGPGLANSP